MSNILSLHNQSPAIKQAELFADLTEEQKRYAENLLNDWYAKLSLIGGAATSTADSYLSAVKRLLSITRKAPWQLDLHDFPNLLQHSFEVNGEQLSYYTVASYASACRSFQSFLLRTDIANEIARATGTRPQAFVDNENTIPVKRANLDKAPKGWALSAENIDDVEDEFIRLIYAARQNGSKAYYALLRDRVMFHIAIHFALRVSELVTITLSQFKPHSSPKMRDKFGQYGSLTAQSKGGVTGTIPMRESAVHELLILYIEKIRPRLLLRRQSNSNPSGITIYHGKKYAISDLLFFSERGQVLNPNSFRKRLLDISTTLMLPQRMTPHTLRHTGCTLMTPLYTPDVAQKYMRHKNLSTTLGYYHPDPISAGAHFNPEYDTPAWFEDSEDY